jgi:microcystin-dependent protein
VADDRPVLTDVAQIAQMQRQIDDLRSTVLARAGRSPTGTIEPSILLAPKPDTLFLQGQVVNRADYPTLWQWVQDNNLLSVGLFGPGDGSTTFGLPDWRGRVLVGAGTLAVGALVGSDSVTLATANIPAHSHTVSNPGNHIHDRTGANEFTNMAGLHDGHNDRSGTSMAGSPPDPTVRYGIATDGTHNHTVAPGDPSGAHTHTVSGPTGTVTPIDNRQASVAVNWLVYV